MPAKQAKQTSNSFHYKFGSVGALLIILGILFKFGLLFLLGLISSLIWAYKYQKQNEQFHWLWVVIVVLLVFITILATLKTIKQL